MHFEYGIGVGNNNQLWRRGRADQKRSNEVELSFFTDRFF